MCDPNGYFMLNDTRQDSDGVSPLAEAVRFELTDGCPSPVFKSSEFSLKINNLR